MIFQIVLYWKYYKLYRNIYKLQVPVIKKDHAAACVIEPSPPSEKPSAPVAVSKSEAKAAAPKKENKSKVWLL